MMHAIAIEENSKKTFTLDWTWLAFFGLGPSIGMIGLWFQFKNRAQIIECSFGCVARSVVLLKLNVANILLFNFWEQKFVQYGPITIAIDCNGLSLLIFEEKWANYASGPKSAPNSAFFSFWVRRLFNVCVGVFCAKKTTILFVYIPAKIEMSFIWKLPKLASPGSRSQAHFLALFKRIHLFDGRIKIIICQIKHALSVTIHEISTSCKKRLDGGSYILKKYLKRTWQLSYIVK